ncbi:MAG: type II toxin-antitoxin system RelE/ParE family toxin [Acidobacteriota bacterium]
MVEVRQTRVYARWFAKLRDRSARAKILVRIRRLQLGNPGDVKSIGPGVSELRVPHGPGYRVYFSADRDRLILLLAGGDKRTQRKDIARALELASAWKEQLDE